jgi:hypothetical protein
VSSGGVDENEFSILLSRDGEFGLVDGGDAVTDRNPLPVDEDRALGRGEIGVAESSRRWNQSFRVQSRRRPPQAFPDLVASAPPRREAALGQPEIPQSGSRRTLHRAGKRKSEECRYPPDPR